MTKNITFSGRLGIAILAVASCGALTERVIVGGAVAATKAPQPDARAKNLDEFVFYDASEAPTQGCTIFLDNKVIPISFETASGARMAFSAVDFRGHSFFIFGDILSDGRIANIHARCNQVFASGLREDAESQAGAEWLSSSYKLHDGRVVGVVHNEYYGGDYPQNGIKFDKSVRCISGQPLSCTYSSISLLISKEIGAPFARVQTEPKHVIARPSFSYSPDYGRATGYFVESNIIRVNDYYYIMAAEFFPNGEIRVCPIRTSDIANASSWRGWDGAGFTIGTPSGREDCHQISIKLAPFHLAYSAYFEKFVAVGTALKTPFHFSYALSCNLVDWSEPVDLGIAPQWSPNAGSPKEWGNFNYPSLVDGNALKNTGDPNASSGAAVGRKPLLLFVDRRGDNQGTRILARPIDFSALPQPAPMSGCPGR